MTMIRWIGAGAWVATLPLLTMAETPPGAVVWESLPGASVLVSMPELALPAALQYGDWMRPKKRMETEWLQFERDFTLPADRGFLDELFYGFGVLAFQLKLAEQDLDQWLNDFDDNVNEALFGPSRKNRKNSGERGFFGRPSLKTVTPLGGSSYSTSRKGELSRTDRLDRRRSHDDGETIGFRLTIPFGR